MLNNLPAGVAATALTPFSASTFSSAASSTGPVAPAIGSNFSDSLENLVATLASAAKSGNVQQAVENLQQINSLINNRDKSADVDASNSELCYRALVSIDKLLSPLLVAIKADEACVPRRSPSYKTTTSPNH